MDDRVAVNGEDGRVPVPDPGDCVILDLTKINKVTNVSALNHVVEVNNLDCFQFSIKHPALLTICVSPGHTWCTLQGK